MPLVRGAAGLRLHTCCCFSSSCAWGGIGTLVCLLGLEVVIMFTTVHIACHALLTWGLARLVKPQAEAEPGWAAAGPPSHQLCGPASCCEHAMAMRHHAGHTG